MKPNAVIIPSCGSNLASLQFALERLGADVPLTEDPARIRAASHVILPGVGAAAPGMERLAAAGLVDVIPTLTQPVLGICLGMQLLFASSEEDETRCLGVIDAEVRRFPPSPDHPVPQMGWNQVRQRLAHPLWRDVPDDSWFYFLHSYYAQPSDECHTAADADYGGRFTCAVARDNIFATQFHPEKSATHGLTLYRNFLAWMP